MKLGFLVRKHLLRVVLGLFLTALFVLNAAGIANLKFTNHLEALSYDLRLNLALSDKVDSRIVIVDIDEKSLAAEGRWPWSRDRLARLMNSMFDSYGVAVVGFDVVFAERDESSGLPVLERLARESLKHDSGYREELARIRSNLDYDSIFAKSIADRPVVLGYYFTDYDKDKARISGALPAPVFSAADLENSSVPFVRMTGYGANLALIQQHAAGAGHFNPFVDSDGICRRIPGLIEYQGKYFESLPIAMVRTLLGNSPLTPIISKGERGYATIESLFISDLKIPVDERVTALVPYRGRQGAFRYVSATDVINGRIEKSVLEGAIVLVGTTASGLMDMRSTPVAAVYPGVEVHANMIAGILDQNIKQKPAYVMGAEMVILLVSGLLLSLLLPVLSPVKSILLCTVTSVCICILNTARRIASRRFSRTMNPFSVKPLSSSSAEYS